MAPEVPHVATVKALVCPLPTHSFPHFPLGSLLPVTYTYKHTILPPAESDGVGDFSSEDEGDIQVSLMATVIKIPVD